MAGRLAAARGGDAVALRLLAGLVGAVVVARAMGDHPIAAKLLKAAREADLGDAPGP